ncbi:MAG: hypothetical protein ACREOG_09125, partial [Gemmatimonadaceae bacterium]
MSSRNDRPRRVRAFRSAATAAALILVRCTDPAVAPRPAEIDEPLHNLIIAATWTPTVLALPKGATESGAQAVNAKEVVVGTVRILASPGPHAVRWKNGHPKYLDEPIGPSSATVATALYFSGIAVGFWIPGIGVNEAVLW